LDGNLFISFSSAETGILPLNKKKGKKPTNKTNTKHEIQH